MNLSNSLLSKLGSIIVHFDEYHSPDGCQVDLDQAKAILKEEEVQKWMKEMGPLLPVKRMK